MSESQASRPHSPGYIPPCRRYHQPPPSFLPAYTGPGDSTPSDSAGSTRLDLRKTSSFSFALPRGLADPRGEPGVTPPPGPGRGPDETVRLDQGGASGPGRNRTVVLRQVRGVPARVDTGVEGSPGLPLHRDTLIRVRTQQMHTPNTDPHCRPPVPTHSGRPVLGVTVREYGEGPNRRERRGAVVSRPVVVSWVGCSPGVSVPSTSPGSVGRIADSRVQKRVPRGNTKRG